MFAFTKKKNARHIEFTDIYKSVRIQHTCQTSKLE